MTDFKVSSGSRSWKRGNGWGSAVLGSIVTAADTGRHPWTYFAFCWRSLLPPLGVFLQVGIGLHFWLNILLTMLGYIPGIIHAIWVIIKK
jgi:uncharacterized membrane protein YqaE (UPF0057 family)